MSLKFVAGLLCDDVRLEVSGKLILIGAYTGEMNYPKFPAAGQFSMLFCVQSGHAFSGAVEFRFRLDDETVAEITGEISLTEDGTMWAPVQLPPLSFAGETILIAEGRVKGDDAWQKMLAMQIRRGPVSPQN